MAFTGKAVLELALVLSINLLMISTDASDIDLGSSLSAKANKTASSYWLSPSGIFAFGFHPQNNSNNNTGFDIAIWMLSQPQPTVVWTATRDATPYSSNATIELTERGLLVHDHHRVSKLIALTSDDDDNEDNEKYYSITSNITSAAMLNSGNFVVYGDTGNADGPNPVIWQSFKFPTDTILGGQNLTAGEELVSSEFRLRMQSDGNLVLYVANSLNIKEDTYWVLNTSFRNEDMELCLNTTGSLYVLSQSRGCDNGSLYVPSQSQGSDGSHYVLSQSQGYDGSFPSQGTTTNHKPCKSNNYCERYRSDCTLYSRGCGPDTGKNFTPRQRENDRAFSIYRATLETDGIFRLYSHSFSSATRNSSVVVRWSALQDHCDVKGFCGLNSYCDAGEGNGRAKCLCYPGFEFINSNKTNLGCYQSFAAESCVSDEKERDHGEHTELRQRLRYAISTKENISWRDHSYSCTQGLDKDLCSKSCLDDCNCWAAMYTSTHDCKKYRLPVMYGKKKQNISAIAFFKTVSNVTDHIPPYPKNHSKVPVDEKNGLILVLASSLGSVLCLLFLFAVASFLVYRRRVYSYKRLLENANLGLAEDFRLQPFSYNELERATNGFSEELGRGSFGAVYKGTTGNKVVAVKRLERVVEEGVREFRAEMTTIGQTHHRNLVQLLGFCVEGSKRLLVYEFMSNGSLSDLLFKAVQRPAWKDRARFALDVARGLFYLHEECGVHIIHCNLKPRNILLDDNWTAKISDFGFARLIMPNPAKLTSGDEESTRYFAPEWQKNALISVKSDIYSFGIVLFEIVCCRRNIDVRVSSPDEIVLSSWAYNCFVSGELFKLVELDDDSTVDMKALERMVKVGLWCVQDDPSLRPLMKNVILMLEGTMDIPVPPSPELPLVR